MKNRNEWRLACVLSVAGLMLAGAYGGEPSVTLVEAGVAKCSVRLGANATPSERLAKAELEKYFAHATGCGALDGAYPIEIATDPSVGEDAFRIETTPTSLRIVGGNDRGVLYGTYELLKKYAGMRWLTPGEDGEYCVHKGKSLAVPVGTDAQRPHLRIRRTIGDDENAAFWHARNGMQTGTRTTNFGKPDGKKWERFEALAVRGGSTGGHILTDLLLGGTPGKTNAERAANLMKEHPEWFPMIDGKRVPTTGAATANPCISNLALLDRMAENLLKLVAGPHACDDYITIGNNDTTVWCQCDRCKALDAPEAKNTRGELSDRYWFMVNEIAKRVWAKRPDVMLGGWAYQNFWYAPVHVRPDPRLRIMISFNNQCWRHTCDDPSCPVNAEMVRVFSSWREIGHPLVINRDEIGAWDGQGSPGCEFEPSESVLFRNMKAYDKIGCSGSSFCVNTPFPEFSSFAKNWGPFYGKRYHWYAMWQTCYMAAKAMWNPDCEYEQTLEEANRLYYGAAWEPAMKEFRALLADSFFKTPGCIGWGQGASIGRCLDRPDSEAKLVALLEKAVSAARIADDARALRHVLREKEIFEMTWLKQRKRYVESYREMTAYKRTGEIVVDGDLGDADWKRADAYTDFALPSWLKKTFKTCQKTSLKVVYDREHLYFGVEAMEPEMDKVIAGDVVDRCATDCANLGNHIELFYSYPDMNQAAWHLMINSKGQIIDALQKSTTDRDASIVTKAKWAVKTYPDRWTLEVAVPCSEIGQNILDGMTWKVNCARVRMVEGLPRAEQTTAANGSFHGTANFVNVKFEPVRPDKTPWVTAEEKTGMGRRAYDIEFIAGSPETDASHFWFDKAKTKSVDINYDESKAGELGKDYELPELMTFADGRKVKTADDWAARRKEILGIFERELYGVMPPKPEALEVELLSDTLSDDRFSRRRTYRTWFRKDRTGPHVDWFAMVPVHAKGRVPVVVHLNYKGNDVIAKGDTNHYKLPLEEMAARGYAFLSAWYKQVTADPKNDEEFGHVYDGVYELWGRRDPRRGDNTGTLMAWAWAMLRGLDLAEKIPEIDATRNVLIGSSRLGKAALLAGAYDERVAVTVPNQTGAVGVQVMRRNYGETLEAQKLMFPHWYCSAAWKYIGCPEKQPFDQHMLLACVAPRALLLECYHKRWFDPKGEFIAAQAASPAWELLTGRGLGLETWPEPYSDAAVNPPFGYVRRTECHGLSPYDWKWALDFADKVWRNRK